MWSGDTTSYQNFNIAYDVAKNGMMSEAEDTTSRCSNIVPSQHHVHRTRHCVRGLDIVSEDTMSYLKKIYRDNTVYTIHNIVILNGTKTCPRHTMLQVYYVISFRCYDIVCLGHDVVHMTDTTSGILYDIVSQDTTSAWSTYQIYLCAAQGSHGCAQLKSCWEVFWRRSFRLEEPFEAES